MPVRGGAAGRLAPDSGSGRKCAEIASGAQRNFILALAAGIAASLLWSAGIHINQNLKLSGTVVAGLPEIGLSAAIDGEVSALFVHPGDHVAEGQLLMIVGHRPGSAASQSASRAEIARFDAELSGARELRFPEDIANSGVATSQLRLFNERVGARNEQRSIADSVIAQKRIALDSLRERQKEIDGEKANINAGLAALPRSPSGADERRQALRLRTALQDATARAVNLSFQIDDAEEVLKEAEARRASLDAEFLSSVAAERAHAVATLSGTGNAEAGAATAETPQTVEVRATQPGTISSLAVAASGDEVRAGVPLVGIEPEGTGTGVDLLLPAGERSNITRGAEAWLAISAYDPVVFGHLRGTVSAISTLPDAILDGMPAYRVHISADFSGFSADNPVVSGMPVTVTFTGHRNTLLELMLTPLDRLRQSSPQPATGS